MTGIINKKRNKGFTLVELVVVLVIISLLAALLIPSLAGYVEIAHDTDIIVSCRHFVTAAQTKTIELYADRTLMENPASIEMNAEDFIADCFVLCELDDNGAIPRNYYVKITMEQNGDITEVEFTDGVFTAIYDGREITAEKGSKLTVNMVDVLLYDEVTP